MIIDHDYKLTLTTTGRKKILSVKVKDVWSTRQDCTGGSCNDYSYTCTGLSQSIFVSVLHWIMSANHVDNYYHQQTFTCEFFADADAGSHKMKIQKQTFFFFLFKVCLFAFYNVQKPQKVQPYDKHF